MKKRAFYNQLAKKYNLPYKYIAFKLDPYYIYKASAEINNKTLETLENAMNWDYINEDFERDTARKESIFYSMKRSEK